MHTSQATVPSARADRYVKQLVSHLGRKATVVPEGDGHCIFVSAGSCTIRADGGKIELVAAADTEQALRTVEDVIARHLQRFGQRDELLVTWGPGAT